MPRFVVLFHKMPTHSDRDDHWDFMLELDDSLATWALPEAPHDEKEIVAEALPPHRKHYLDYEGPVSKNRGEVSQWDTGTFEWLVHAADEVCVRMLGNKLNGVITLKKTECWHFQFDPTSPIK